MREKAKHEDIKEEERVRQRKHYICYRGQEVKTERERQATLLNRINRTDQICYRVGGKTPLYEPEFSSCKEMCA